jgi:hypothetical protein
MKLDIDLARVRSDRRFIGWAIALAMAQQKRSRQAVLKWLGLSKDRASEER